MGFGTSPYLLKGLFLSFLFMVLVFPQCAQAEAIAVEHTLGFNGVFRLKNWTPLTVVMENRHKGILGQMEVVVTSGSEYRNDVYHTTYSTEVDLPTQSKKTYAFTIFIDSYIHPLIIRLKNEKEIIFSKSINLRGHDVTKPLLIFAGENPNVLSPLQTKDYEAVYSPVQFLPETWYGYHGAKGLIMKAGLWKNLRPRQYAAIVRWIETGGYVITTGSPYDASRPLERLERLISIRVAGFERVREIPALQAFCGAKLAPREPFLISKIAAPQAETILREKDFSLILEKDIGLGKILFFAFDVTDSPFRDWPGREAFWEKILHLGPVAEAVPVHPEEEKFFSFLLSKMPSRFPSFLILFPLLLGYIFLVSFLLKRIEKKRKQAWKTLFFLGLAVLLSSSADYGLSFMTQTRNRLSWNGILQVKISAPQPMARWKYHLGVYTQKDGEFRLPLGPDDLLVAGLPTENSDAEKFQSYALYESNETYSLLFFLHRWSHRYFTLSGVGTFPFRAKAQIHEQEVSLSIENRSSLPLMNCNVYYGGRLFGFGTIAPDERVLKRLNLKALGSDNAFTPKGVEAILKPPLMQGSGSFQKEMEMELTRDLWISIHERNQWKMDKIILVGWIDSPILPAEMKLLTPFRNGISLLEWEIPLET
jgi:hypothetical protein